MIYRSPVSKKNERSLSVGRSGCVSAEERYERKKEQQAKQDAKTKPKVQYAKEKIYSTASTHI